MPRADDTTCVVTRWPERATCADNDRTLIDRTPRVPAAAVATVPAGTVVVVVVVVTGDRSRTIVSKYVRDASTPDPTNRTYTEVEYTPSPASSRVQSKESASGTVLVRIGEKAPSFETRADVAYAGHTIEIVTSREVVRVCPSKIEIPGMFPFGAGNTSMEAVAVRETPDALVTFIPTSYLPAVDQDIGTDGVVPVVISNVPSPSRSHEKDKDWYAAIERDAFNRISSPVNVRD